MMSRYRQADLAAFSAEELRRFRMTRLSLGVEPETRDEVCVSTEHRESGMYVIGKQGSGKSSFLKTLIHQDIVAGNAVFVLDPHLDLTHEAVAEMAAERVKDTSVFDMTDEGYPFGINLFAVGLLTTEQQKEQAIERVMHVFDVLWPEVMSQQNLPRFLRMAVITLLANPGSTLVDMYQFLLDETFRRRLLARVSDPTVLTFWATQYDSLRPDARLTKVQPLLGRLEALFAGRSLIRNIVGQRRTTINWRQAIERREVVFIKLPVNAMAQNAYLLGTMIVGQLAAALFSYADTPREQRPGVSIYIDEFQNFTTTDFRKIFTEGRKYGARLTVAHQYRTQLPDYLQDSTLTARTIVCFNVTSDDAPDMAKQFPFQEARLRPEDMELHPVRRLLADTPDDRHARTLASLYLRTMLTYKRGANVEVAGEHWNVDTKQLLLWGVRRGVTKQKFTVSDPTLELDPLLLQTMRTGNWQATIPVNAVAGLCNAGKNFFGIVRSGRYNGALFANYQFPRHLVAETETGVWWVGGEPRSALDQFLHCVFTLRQTMKYLAEHPIGKPSAPTTNAVAQSLLGLAPREALVRSDKTVVKLFTHETPRPLTGETLERRMAAIREQTRAKYCHPKAAVEAALRGEGMSVTTTTTQGATTRAAEPVMADAVVDADAVHEGSFSVRGPTPLDTTLHVRAVASQQPHPSQHPAEQSQQSPEQPGLRRLWQEIQDGREGDK